MSELTSTPRIGASFINSDLLPSVAGLQLPTVEPHTYALLDDDDKMCRVISEDELEESYVDNNIDTFVLQGVDSWTLAVDEADVSIVYFGGARTSLLLGSISFGTGQRAKQYAKTNGVIYPITTSGALLLNKTNTPRLVLIRTFYHEEAKRVNDTRIEYAEITWAFGQAIGNLGNVPGHLGR